VVDVEKQHQTNKTVIAIFQQPMKMFIFDYKIQLLMFYLYCFIETVIFIKKLFKDIKDY
jgi:hypothetical protein